MIKKLSIISAIFVLSLLLIGCSLGGLTVTTATTTSTEPPSTLAPTTGTPTTETPTTVSMSTANSTTTVVTTESLSTTTVQVTTTQPITTQTTTTQQTTTQPITTTSITTTATTTTILYQVTFDSNGGSYVSPIEVATGNYMSLETPTKEGHTFLGWFKNDGTPFTGTSIVDEDITVYAHWRINQYTISFNTQGGPEIPSITQDYGTPVVEPEVPVREEYVFEAWRIINMELQTAEDYEFTTMPAENITVYMVWTWIGDIDPDNFTYTLLEDNTYSVTGYLGDSYKITIPDMYQGVAVTQIGPDAFKDLTDLVDITVPNSITYISEGAFAGCSNIQRLSLPFVGQSRTATGANALLGYIFGSESYTGGLETNQYYDMSNYVTYYIPERLGSLRITDAIEIQFGAFYNCSEIYYIEISESVQKIKPYSFSGLSSLMEVSLPFVGASRTATLSQAMFGYIFGSLHYPGGHYTTQLYDDSSTLISYIPQQLTHVTITDDISINRAAFSHCEFIQSIVIEEGVTIIEDYAFNYNYLLREISLPDSLLTLGDYIFMFCNSLESITIPANVESIGKGILAECPELISITIPFVGSSQSATGSDSLLGHLFSKEYFNSIDGDVPTRQYYDDTNYIQFFLPDNLSSVTVTNATKLEYGAFSNFVDITNIVLPETLESIGKNAFSGCVNLVEIIIPQAVTKIGENAFYDCNKVTIYTSLVSKPDGWDINWNPSNAIVVWDYIE